MRIMARGRKAKRTRKRDTRFNLIGGVESLIYGNLIFETVAGTSLPGFFTEDAISEGESLQGILEDPTEAAKRMASNLRDPRKLVMAGVTAWGISAGFKFFNKSLSMPRRKVNASLKQFGLPVKV